MDNQSHTTSALLFSLFHMPKAITLLGIMQLGELFLCSSDFLTFQQLDG